MQLCEAVRIKEGLDLKFLGEAVLVWIFECEGQAALIVETTTIRPDVLIAIEEMGLDSSKMVSTLDAIWPMAMAFR